MSVLVDSHVILDVLSEDPNWFDWFSATLERVGSAEALVINPMVFGKVSVQFERTEEVDLALVAFERSEIPYEVAFLAAKCFLDYRRRGGARSAPLPDFYIGAHALLAGMTLLTRDAARYRTYFPRPIVRIATLLDTLARQALSRP